MPFKKPTEFKDHILALLETQLQELGYVRNHTNPEFVRIHPHTQKIDFFHYGMRGKALDFAFNVTARASLPELDALYQEIYTQSPPRMLIGGDISRFGITHNNRTDFHFCPTLLYPKKIAEIIDLARKFNQFCDSATTLDDLAKKAPLMHRAWQKSNDEFGYENYVDAAVLPVIFALHGRPEWGEPILKKHLQQRQKFGDHPYIDALAAYLKTRFGYSVQNP